MKLYRRFLLAACVLLLFSGQALAVEAGQQAPDFSLPGSGQQSLKLSEFRGKLVYLDFWASWCESCKQSLPWMASLSNTIDPAKFEVIAVNLDSERADAEEMLNMLNAKFRVAFDAEGQTPEMFNVQAMPSSFLIDPQGKVISVFEGFDAQHRMEIERQIQNQLKANGA